jgi:hypothetical protein
VLEKLNSASFPLNKFLLLANSITSKAYTHSILGSDTLLSSFEVIAILFFLPVARGNVCILAWFA